MSPKPQQSAPLLRRSYLVALGVITVLALPLVLRERGPRWWRQIRNFIGGEQTTVHVLPPSVPMADETAQALQSMRTFLFELAEKGNEKLSGFADIRPPKSSGAVDPGGDDDAPPPPPLLQRQIWELPIHAITYERSGWVAWVGTNRLEPGTQIAMSNSPSGPCGFRILSVSRYCVWAWVVLDDQDLQAKAPDIQWPDFVSVRVMQEGKVNRPVGLVMPDDRLLPLNRAVRFTRTRSSLSLERLWPRGGELTLLLADGKPLARLICVLPAR